MPIEQAIDGTVIHVVSYPLLEGVPDLGSRRDQACLSLLKERREKLLFFFQREILTSTASLS